KTASRRCAALSRSLDQAVIAEHPVGDQIRRWREDIVAGPTVGDIVRIAVPLERVDLVVWKDAIELWRAAAIVGPTVCVESMPIVDRPISSIERDVAQGSDRPLEIDVGTVERTDRRHLPWIVLLALVFIEIEDGADDDRAAIFVRLVAQEREVREHRQFV